MALSVTLNITNSMVIHLQHASSRMCPFLWTFVYIVCCTRCSVTRLDYGFIWWTNKVGFWIPIQFVEMKSKIDYFHMMSIKITEQQTNFGIRATPGDLKGDQRTLSRSSNVLFNLVYVGVIWVLCRAISEVWKYGYG